jgi:hypothetical protein
VSPRLVSAAELADYLGVKRAWVYENAISLGAKPLGDGPKPRLRFDLEEAKSCSPARQAGSQMHRFRPNQRVHELGGDDQRAQASNCCPFEGRFVAMAILVRGLPNAIRRSCRYLRQQGCRGKGRRSPSSREARRFNTSLSPPPG